MPSFGYLALMEHGDSHTLDFGNGINVKLHFSLESRKDAGESLAPAVKDGRKKVGIIKVTTLDAKNKKEYHHPDIEVFDDFDYYTDISVVGFRYAIVPQFFTPNEKGGFIQFHVCTPI